MIGDVMEWADRLGQWSSSASATTRQQMVFKEGKLERG